MNTAAYYAKALYELGEAHPQQIKEYIKNLQAALARRGHEKLLPRILSELQKLELQAQRTARHRDITPQMKQTDTLVQLYRRLIATN